MKDRIVKYLEGSLTNAERKALLADSQKDLQVQGELADFRRLNSLMALSEDNANSDAGEKGYSSLMRRVRMKKVKRACLAAAACAALLLLGGVGVSFLPGLFNGVQQEAVPMLSVSAPAGHRAQAILPDGTEVWLNAGSRLEYPSLFDRQRRVSLVGEGFFKVAPDAEHPFIVSARDVEVKALGTQFNVRNYDEKLLLVSLIEGSVAVYHSGCEGDCMELAPGETVVEMSEGSMKKITLSESPDYWMKGYFYFNDKSLGMILRDLELYYDVEITVEDPDIQDYRFTGKFYQTDGILEILRILQKVYPFTVRRDKDSNTIHITKRRLS